MPLESLKCHWKIQFPGLKPDVFPEITQGSNVNMKAFKETLFRASKAYLTGFDILASDRSEENNTETSLAPLF